MFNKIRGAVGVLGALNAINTLNMNGLAPYKKAKTIQRVGETIRSLEIRQQAIMAVYKKRKRFWTATRGIKRVGEKIFDFLAFDWRKKKDIMNIEELATLYHFPVITTKAPLIKKTSSKRGEPPIGLPTK